MQMPDVNTLVYAHRGELPQHERYRDWLSGLLNGLESYGVCDLVTLGFQRLVTNPKIFREPTRHMVGGADHGAKWVRLLTA